jgi:1-aminocyclopropane-1-carboxylate deaminase
MTDIKPDLNKVCIESWDHPIFRRHLWKVDVLRLDKIHPEISGNKWFKLKYYLERACLTNKKKLISFGGAYSNHLLALAAAARMYGFTAVGNIRGEEPRVLSHTLKAAKDSGMELHFLSRPEYDRQKKLSVMTMTGETESIFIPEGGASTEGIKGAADILSLVPAGCYNHICVAVGTGTTISGLINGAEPGLKIIGVSVLKGTIDFQPLNTSWIEDPAKLAMTEMKHDYHFGGYARITQTLIDFMNRLYTDSGIPTDIVYTGKLFYGVLSMADLKAFPAGSRILVLHSGGLQGNGSLRPGQLQF